MRDFETWVDDARQKMTKDGASADTLSKFVQNCDEIRSRIHGYVAGGDSNIKSVKIETLKSNENLFQVVRFRAAFKFYSGISVQFRDKRSSTDLVSMLNKTPVEELGDRQDYEASGFFCFGEPDAERHLIETLPTTDPTLLRRFQQSGTTAVYSVTGILLANPVSRKFELLMLELKEPNSPLDLVEPTVREIEDAKRLITTANGHSLLPVFRNMVVQAHSIVDPGDAKFMEALDAVILQGASHGMINDENGRIHNHFISAPSMGKGVLAKVARTINPIYKKVEPQAVTEDGLFGNSGSSGGKRIIRAGLIPQAHLGVFIVEDFHQANSLKNQRLNNSFTATMETGRCEAGNASRTSYAAHVAFHVDANRMSDVDERKRSNHAQGSKLGQITHETGVLKNVLTRFDYIVEFDRDPLRQLRIVDQLAGQAVCVTAGSTSVSNSSARAVQVALAVLRTQIPEIEISTSVAEYLRMRFFSIINVGKQVLDENPQYADFMTRGVKSYRKFIAAHARLCNRSSAIKEDVDAVFPFVMRKFETILQWIVGDVHNESNQSFRKEARRLCIGLKFGGRNVTLSDVRNQFPNVSDKTLKRDMDAVCGSRNGEETWTVPEFNSQPNPREEPAENQDGDLFLPDGLQ